LRVADALDRSHDARVQDVECRLDGETFRLELLSEQDCEREIAAAEQKRDLFEETFDCRLELHARSPEPVA
jgi:hypothetical protein